MWNIAQESILITNQTQSEPTHKVSGIRFAALFIGGGCALIACLALIFVLGVRFLGPQIGGIFSQINIGANNTPSSTQVNIILPAPRPHPQANGNTMGNPKAPVKIIEYADFQCPFCLRYWQETELQLINTYITTGKVYYEYRSVGAFIGPESASAAEAAYCAGDQGKFWEYHDVLYSNWTGENAGDFTPDKLRQFAEAIGLDSNKFDDCLNRGIHASQVEQDVTEAKADGVQATPSFLINRKLIKGAQPFGVFQQAIETALKGN